MPAQCRPPPFAVKKQPGRSSFWGSANFSIRKDSPGEPYTFELNSSQVRRAQIRVSQVGVRQIGARQIGARQIGFPKIDPLQIGLL